MNTKLLSKYSSIEIKNVYKSSDGSLKYVLSTLDGRIVEAICFHFTGLFNRKYLDSQTVCLSSQVGCPIGCKFCASGRIKNPRNLSLRELIDQFYTIEKDLTFRGVRPIRSVAIMGMGEPLLNLDNVVNFYLELANDKKIDTFTLSTVGIISGIKKLRELKTKIKLYLSVHSPFEKERSSIIPINERYPITKVVRECRLLAHKTSRTVVANYVLIHGFNDSIEHAKALAQLLNPNDFDITLNLLNKIPKLPFKSSSFEKMDIFKKVLESYGYSVDIQLSKGKDIAGGCGQLAGVCRTK